MIYGRVIRPPFRICKRDVTKWVPVSDPFYRGRHLADSFAATVTSRAMSGERSDHFSEMN